MQTRDMKVIFLDIDGVLNSERWFVQRHIGGARIVVVSREDGQIDPECVERLNRLTEVTGAVLVISSTWRIGGMDWLVPLLRRKGVAAEIIGRTPDLNTVRGHEIGHWLSEHPEVGSYVILDDTSDMGALAQRLVKVSWQTGLTDGDVERATAMLQAGAE